MRDVGYRRKQRTVRWVERERDYGRLGKRRHRPIVRRIKELSTRKQCHEREFSSCRGFGEVVPLDGGFYYDRQGGVGKPFQGLGFPFLYSFDYPNGQTGPVYGGGHVGKSRGSRCYE